MGSQLSVIGAEVNSLSSAILSSSAPEN